MSDAVQLKLAKGVPLLIAALPGMLAAFFAYKAHFTAQETKEIAKKTEENTNHMKDELVAEVRKSSHAEGVREGEAAK